MKLKWAFYEATVEFPVFYMCRMFRYSKRKNAKHDITIDKSEKNV